jgi:hypothetical protein
MAIEVVRKPANHQNHSTDIEREREFVLIMDRHEYKRQNEQREARKQEKLLEKANSEKVWYQRRPKWWRVPSDRFSFFVAAFTGALAFFSVWQLIVIRGQLDAMERDQQPYVGIGDKINHPSFEPVVGSKGEIIWPWYVTNFGKGEARELTVDAFIRIGGPGQPFKRTPRQTGPGWMGELAAGRSDNGIVKTEAIYDAIDFKRVDGTDFAIAMLLEIQYLGLGDKRFEKSVCISKFALGGMGIDDPERCKKFKQQ